MTVAHLLSNFRIKEIIQLIRIKAAFTYDLDRQSKVAKMNYSNNYFIAETYFVCEDQIVESSFIM